MRAAMMMSGMPMGGAERNIVSVLPYLRDAGVEVSLITLNTRRDSPLVERLQQEGIPRHDLGAKRMTDPGAVRRFFNLIREERLDIMHPHDQDTKLYAALARRLMGTPVVMTRHVLELPTDTLKELLRVNMVYWVSRFGADRIISVSDAVRQRFADQSHIKIDRITTVYNGIHVAAFDTRDRRAAKRAELGWDADAPVIIMVAVLRRGKGHEVLFQAVPQIAAAVPGVKIKLVGDGGSA